MARGVPGIEALDMSKFFDTNYHYLVPELTSTVSSKPDFGILLDKVKRGQATIGKEKAIPIIIGALSSPLNVNRHASRGSLEWLACKHGPESHASAHLILRL